MAFTFCKCHKQRDVIVFVYIVVVVVPSYGSDDIFFSIAFYVVSNLTVKYTVFLTPTHTNLFSAYEGLKRSLDIPSGETGGINTWKLLFAGGLAGTLSWASIYPLGKTFSSICSLVWK